MAAPLQVTVANLLRRWSCRGWQTTSSHSSPYSSQPTPPQKPPSLPSPSELERRGVWEVQYEQPDGMLVPGEMKKPKEPSIFPKLEISTDLVVWLQQDFDVSIKGFRKWWTKKKNERDIYDQRYIPKRFLILGADLAAAHFMVHRGGAVRFTGSDTWVRKDQKGYYNLPQTFIPNISVDAIDVGDMDLLYDGLINLELVTRLRWLSLRNCKRVDDWFLDRLTGFRDVLEYLDLSGCVNVSERGLTALTRMGKLRVLKLYDMKHIKHLNLFCILLEEALPNCKIEGVDYMNPSVLDSGAEQSDKELLVADTASMKLSSQKVAGAITDSSRTG